MDFYSNDSEFLITASYLGCDSIINNVPVTLNSTDGFDYGSSDFQLSPKLAKLTGAGPWDVPVMVILFIWKRMEIMEIMLVP